MAVLNMYHHGKRVPDGAVNIMRGTIFGNPFIMGKHGDRDAVVAQYRVWLHERIQKEPAFAAEVKALHGRDLCCCCAPKSCHGHVLEKAAAYLQTI